MYNNNHIKREIDALIIAHYMIETNPCFEPVQKCQQMLTDELVIALLKIKLHLYDVRYDGYCGIEGYDGMVIYDIFTRRDEGPVEAGPITISIGCEWNGNDYRGAVMIDKSYNVIVPYLYSAETGEDCLVHYNDFEPFIDKLVNFFDKIIKE